MIEGGTDDDVVLGDNGRITRPVGVTSTSPAPAYRDVAMADTVADTTSGSDDIRGDAGDDVLYGQLDDATTAVGTGDRIDGGADQDALLGDLGVVTVRAAASAVRPATGDRQQRHDQRDPLHRRAAGSP